MIEWIEHIDREVLFFINGDLTNSFFDFLAPWWRNKFFWFPLYAIFLFLLFSRYRQKMWIPLLGAALTVTAADQISSAVVKQSVERYRPCKNSEIKDQVILRLESCGAGYSFTSSHATNHFAIAIFIGLMLARKRWQWMILLAWASSIAIAQVYVGVHYPTDVFAGAILGSLIGGLVGFGARKGLRRVQSEQ